MSGGEDEREHTTALSGRSTEQSVIQRADAAAAVRQLLAAGCCPLSADAWTARRLLQAAHGTASSTGY